MMLMPGIKPRVSCVPKSALRLLLLGPHPSETPLGDQSYQNVQCQIYSYQWSLQSATLPKALPIEEAEKTSARSRRKLRGRRRRGQELRNQDFLGNTGSGGRSGPVNQDSDVSGCYGLNVWVLFTFICPCSNPQYDGIWRWGPWEVIIFIGGNESGHHDGISALIRCWREQSSVSLFHLRTQEKAAVCKQEESIYQQINPLTPLSWTSQLAEL